MRVVKSTYYSNWGDLVGYKLAHTLMPLALKIPFLTPNIITIVAFTSFLVGSLMLLLPYPLNALGGFLIFSGYVGDDLDGQFARVTKKYSVIGDYLDKVLDIVKIFLVSFFAGLAAFFQTGNMLFILLGFIAAFFFMLRYYIKLETMFSAISRDSHFLDKSSEKRGELEHEMDLLYAKKPKNPTEALKIGWIKMRTIFLVDEAEFAIFTFVGTIFNVLPLVVIILAVAQFSIAMWRAVERGYQLTHNSENLLRPLRK